MLQKYLSHNAVSQFCAGNKDFHGQNVYSQIAISILLCIYWESVQI